MAFIDRLQTIQFNGTELVSILKSAQEFDYKRAGRWMDDHVVFALQMVAVYLTVIFALKERMRNRAPYDLRMPLATWNFLIANLSGLSALAMVYQLATTTYNEGMNATICRTQDELYGGRMGYAMFCLLLARLPEFIDTFFIVLRKQPLLFIHWYHHACTLVVGWFTYSTAFPAAAHVLFINANIHTAMYSYYYVTALGMRPPGFVAKTITFWQVVQFVLAFYGMCYVFWFHYILEMPCRITTQTFCALLAMIASYLYLFTDFFVTKYTGRTVPQHKQLLKKAK
ncbi:hypothetical protein PRIPAC_81253 [Pristionchus pacificus]|uniref:Elongation of very long chain fatty acids protein n=1 Tax=Pristionchus pacificus TaxID=54126 RepID=A0A2A6CK74_PRIPA|nr:hypothetical protein PRIPAC_81253 [Pristionchus pacificus]|eukprot:PDM78477.1 hypothetical protein PRIPAC_31056 [Pristionchus pacificus]